MLELLFLLLPIAAFYGYYMGSHSSKQEIENNKSQHIRSFMKGINYFLSRDKDRAVDALISYYDSKVEHTFEECMTLASLFREKGELDRAIKFHKKIIEDSSTTPEERSYALLELATDFKRAGLLSNAEEILLELITYNSQKKRAVSSLVLLYQQEREWMKAISIVESYKKILEGDLVVNQGQFYCELATEHFSRANYSEAENLFKKALAVHPKCVRAMLNLAKIEIEKKRFDKVVSYLDQIINTDVVMSGLVVKILNKACEAILPANEIKQRKLNILKNWLDKAMSVPIVLELCNVLEDMEGLAKADEFIIRIAKSYPNIDVFSRMLKMSMVDLDAKSIERIGIIRDLIEHYKNQTPRFVCHRCGFETKMLFWQCPGCRRWESLKPANSMGIIEKKITSNPNSESK